VSSGANIYYQTTLQLSSGRLLVENGATVAGNTLTLPNPVPTGDSLGNGSPVYTSTGGPFAAYFRSHQLAADQVTPNTFYYANDIVGLVKWTNCGATTIVSPASQGFMADADNDLLKAVPGQAGHLFFTTGYVGGSQSNHPSGNRFWRTCNGTNSTAGSVTMQVVPGFWEVQAFGFGHAAPGQSYPAIYIVGWYSPDDNVNDAVYGVWRSINDVNDGTTGTCSGGNTWVNLASDTNGFPAGFPTLVEDIEGDPFVYGPYYVLGAFGQFYGVQE
jgi:xyloglucan-specific exo-beta-1,4-glucanase